MDKISCYFCGKAHLADFFGGQGMVSFLCQSNQCASFIFSKMCILYCKSNLIFSLRFDSKLKEVAQLHADLLLVLTLGVIYRNTIFTD